MDRFWGIINWILEEKEWLFSGIGVVVVVYFLGGFRHVIEFLRSTLTEPKLSLYKLKKLKFWGISWDFTGYFLGMDERKGEPIFISSLQLPGRNNTGKPIEKIDGYIESSITNRKIPILLNSMPPEETDGIPPKCDFRINALFRDSSSEREGIEVENFLREFPGFLLVINFDKKQFEYRFSKKEIKAQIGRYRTDAYPAPVPAVTKKDA